MYMYIYIHTYIPIHTYIYICVCVCVCICKYTCMCIFTSVRDIVRFAQTNTAPDSFCPIGPVKEPKEIEIGLFDRSLFE